MEIHLFKFNQQAKTFQFKPDGHMSETEVNG